MTFSMAWYMSDVEATLMAHPEYGTRYEQHQPLSEADRERIDTEDRRARSLSAQRAMCASIACPRCNAPAGEPCNRRIGRKSSRERLWGFHRDRYEAALGNPKSATAAPAAPTSRTSANVPISDKPKARRRGPSNAGDLPFAQRRFREARHRQARTVGNFLATPYDDDTATPPARVKFRPAATAALRVSIGPAAWREIVRRVQVEDGDRETGGLLAGIVTSDTVRIARSSGPGADADQSEERVVTRLTDDDVDALTTGSKVELQILGSWHSHPYGLGEPSKTDIRTLTADHQAGGIVNPIMVIVRPSLTTGWAAPVPAVWMLTASDDQRFDFDVRVADLARPLT